MSDDKYARIYWTVMEDEKFDGIREDVRLFGSWSLLLVVADMAWPVPAYVPPTVPRSAFARLVEARLIDELPGHRFRVHGLDGERGKRQDSARNAAAKRWHSDGIAETMPSKAEQSRAKQSRPKQTDGHDIVDDYYRLTGRFPNDSVMGWVERLSNEFTYDAASRKLAAEYTADPNLRTLLGRVENALKSEKHIATRQQAEAEKARLEAWNKDRRITPEQAAENKRRIAELQREWFGGPKEAA